MTNVITSYFTSQNDVICFFYVSNCYDYVTANNKECHEFKAWLRGTYSLSIKIFPPQKVWDFILITGVEVQISIQNSMSLFPPELQKLLPPPKKRNNNPQYSKIKSDC